MNLSNKEIVDFFREINKLNLSRKEKNRMYKLFQVRGSNNKNKVMTYDSFKMHLKKEKGNITSLVLGPKWSRLVFVDIDVEV